MENDPCAEWEPSYLLFAAANQHLIPELMKQDTRIRGDEPCKETIAAPSTAPFNHT